MSAPTADAPHLRDGRGTALAAHRVTKRFQRTLAVDDLSFELGEGEVVALLGENGAGKSTIISVLAGLFGGDFDGELTVGDEPYEPSNVEDAERRGIVLIAQEINVVPELTVAQSLFLGHEPRRWGLVDHLAMRRDASTILADFDVDVDPVRPIGSLDLARQQLVMIARSLHKDAKILILDEPTAALTGAEADRLFDRLRTYRERGTTCIFVSHRLAEVFAIADRILVLRDMLGMTSGVRAVPPAIVDRSHLGISVRDLTVRSADRSRRILLDQVSLDVRGGEIVGVFGLVGSGVGVVGQSLFGAWRGEVDGRIEIDGRAVRIRSPRDAITHGVGFITQDRRDALVGIHSVAENMAMASLDRFGDGPFLDNAELRTEARRWIDQLDIRTPDETAPVSTLSGGNQQKVQVARWLVADTPILILDDPTRGVDVGARAEIHGILAGLARSGKALLLVSSDASELLAVCARVLVIWDGRIAGEVETAESSESELLEIASGLSQAVREASPA